MVREYYRGIPGDMFDFYKYYRKIAESLPNNCVIAEVGVADGKSSLMLADELYKLGKEFTFYLIDSLDYGGKDQLNTIINHVIRAGIDGIQVWPYDSLEACNKFPDVHFDFVFLDSSHLYEMTKLEIKAWYPKIKEGGILAGHDYIAHDQVRRAVSEVIPKTVTRTDIPERKFKPEQVLMIEQTDLNYGVWWLNKKWYVSL